MSINDITPQQWDSVRATEKQIGGNHYKDKGIQPLEYAYANGLTPNLTNVVKYVTRKKGDIPEIIKDLRKGIHYIELELEMVYGVDPEGNPYD